jgi:hypothetical protein
MAQVCRYHHLSNFHKDINKDEDAGIIGRAFEATGGFRKVMLY